MELKLLHNAHTTHLSPEEAILEVLNNRTVEVDMAVSGYGYSVSKDDLEYDPADVYDSYEIYFQNTADELTKILGQPFYNRVMPKIDKKTAELYNSNVETLDHLIVWEKDDTKIYLRFGVADEDSPIFVVLGCEGCKPTGNEYPEPVYEVCTLTPEEINTLRLNAFLKEERKFYDSLGAESSIEKCKKTDCSRGRISLSVFCRVHHYEAMCKAPCPFQD